jgi:hypothetical protein
MEVRMLGMRNRALVVSALALLGVIAFGAVALASPFSAPILKAPRGGQHVHAGVVTLIVADSGIPKDVRPVYVTISPRRTLDKFGHLKTAKNCSSRCDFVKLHPRKGHPGQWIYKSQFNFPGYWAVTDGKYYWQAEHVAPLCQAKGCEVVSKISTFHIVG